MRLYDKPTTYIKRFDVSYIEIRGLSDPEENFYV